MNIAIVEASNGFNWGKFLVARFQEEWQRHSVFEKYDIPLLDLCGWGHEHLLVLDLQTGEGALFRPGGYPTADLEKHRIWVCPLFEPFLAWLYQQSKSDLIHGDLAKVLPEKVMLPNASQALSGYRRPGPPDAPK